MRLRKLEKTPYWKGRFKDIYAADNPEYTTFVKKIADAFEADLALGKHQDHFGEIMSEAKKIRGVGKKEQRIKWPAYLKICWKLTQHYFE